ncbi:hypothetical protein U2T19_003942 [Salmonella enterica]|nr:hypothetical protein [Salmonella enterica]EMA3597665.1 hypothetical protein [Salmonella enterica]
MNGIPSGLIKTVVSQGSNHRCIESVAGKERDYGENSLTMSILRILHNAVQDDTPQTAFTDYKMSLAERWGI